MNLNDMKVYAITYDYKSLHCLSQDCYENDLIDFSIKLPRNHAESYHDMWHPPDFYHEKDNPILDTFFASFFKAKFTFYDELFADQEMIQLLQSYGEILPLPLSDSDKKAYVYHCMNTIKNEKEALLVHTGPKKHLLEKTMSKEKIPSRGLFLIYPSLYTVENEELGVESNFKMLYDARRYTGLEFVEMKLV